MARDKNLNKNSEDLDTQDGVSKTSARDEKKALKNKIKANKKEAKRKRKERKKEEKKLKKAAATPWDMYTGLATSALLSTQPISTDRLGSGILKIGHNFIHSDDCLQAFFYVSSFPQEIPVSIMEDIRKYMNFERVRVNFDIWMSPEYIPWESTQMRDRQAGWERMLEESAATEDKFLESQKRNLTTEREKWLTKSWAYVAKADRDKKGIIRSNFIIKLRTIDNHPESVDEFLIACKQLKRYAMHNQIELKRISGYIIDFLQNISPLMSNNKVVSSEFVNDRVLVDEIIANMMTYTPGKLSESEVFMGIDVFTNRLTFMDFNDIRKRSLNILLAGSTSSGKSFYSKCLLRECLAMNKNCIILDRDCEYIPFAEKVGGIVLNLSRSAGKYFDSVQIGEPTDFAEIDDGLYEESLATTTSIFNILVSVEHGMDTTQRKIFNMAYSYVLYKAGVIKDDPSTWKNSSKLSFYDIYDAIVMLSRNSAHQKRYGNAILDFADTLSIYFDPNGYRNYLFKEKISINDILEKKRNGDYTMIDICLYLDADSDKSEEGKIETNIKYTTANYLTILLTNYFKSLEEETVVFVEEYNRYIEDDDMQKLIINMITGNRKRNAATVLITNNPQEIVIGGEKVTRALADNIKNLIIGKVENTATIEKLCNAWNMEYCMDTLNDISTKAHFRHCFLLKKENGEIAVVRQVMPDELIHSKVFSTAD